MLYYRKDLFKAAGLTMPAHPTWTQVASLRGQAEPAGQGGRDLPARPGRAGATTWPSLDTVVNTFGGEWFNLKWQPQLTSPAFEAATNFYVNLIRKDGEAGASNDSFNQLLTLYGQGKCAMWYDATVAATSITTSFPSIAAQTGYAFAPVDKTNVVRVAVDVVAGHPAGHRELRRRLEVRVLGHLEGIRLAGRVQVRLGRGPAGQPGPRCTTTRPT